MGGVGAYKWAALGRRLFLQCKNCADLHSWQGTCLCQHQAQIVSKRHRVTYHALNIDAAHDQTLVQDGKLPTWRVQQHTDLFTA